jgi:hypothetical protein
MSSTKTRLDPRVDAYIAKSAPFARPILEHLRATVHAALPSASEAIKWGMPFFEHAGKPVASMAAFKQHCAFGFWQGKQVAETDKDGQAMGQFGRITTVTDLPSTSELNALLKKSAALIDAGVKPARAPKTAGRQGTRFAAPRSGGRLENQRGCPPVL